MTGSSGCWARIWRNSVTPSSPEVASRRKFMSCTTRSTGSRARASMPCAAESAPIPRAPCMDSSTSSAVRTASLSSMTSTVRSLKLSWSPWLSLSFMKLDAAKAETVARLTSLDRPAGPRRGDRRRPPGRLHGRREPDQPDGQHAAHQVVEVEGRQLVLDRDPVADAERGAAAGDDARGRDHPVLDQEVPDDVEPARTDGAARADL